MIRRVQLVVFAVLIAASIGSAHGAAPGSVSGEVRNSVGTPQIGAQVQLLRPDLTVIASVYTDAEGHFYLPAVLPGRYAIKAMGAWFLPSLRENVRVRANTVVNLTLNTLYEAMQWLPAEPRAGNAPKDDWAWTLRSSANRPLLRWLEDGPLLIVSDSTGTHPHLKARLVATGQEGAFGESGERITVEVEETPSNSRELLASVDFAPGTDAGMESMLGFRQDLGFAGSVQSVAAVAVHPELGAAGVQGLNEAALRSWETMHLGDEVEVEAGSEQVLARFSGPVPETVAELLPFASAGWRYRNATFRYRMTTFMSAGADSEETEAQNWLPALSLRNGALALEHGNHQELGLERRTDISGVAFLVYTDRIDNPVLESSSLMSSGESAAGTMLFDRASGLLRAAGPRFTAAGVVATFEHNLPGRNHLRLSYANGNALVLFARPITLAQLIASAHPRRAQAYSLSLSGTLEGTGTRWRASYRWQPEDTVTEVAPFAAEAAQPYLNMRLRQPIHLRCQGSSSFDAVLDLSNLLAQGYRPYLLSDGSLVIFAQDHRSIRAGLAFNF